jgi:error-prone DNA polymerase
MSYAELFCKTNFSFLEGASHPAELVRQASALGLHALAITDVDGVYGLPKAYAESKQHPALRLLTGAVVRLVDHPPLRLIATDRAAYGLLCRMLTAVHQKGSAQDPSQDPSRDSADPSGANAGGFGWQDFSSFFQGGSQEGLGPNAASGFFALPESFCSGLLAANKSELEAQWPEPRWGELRELFGERLSLPLCRVLDGRDSQRTLHARRINTHYGIPWVAVNDVLAHAPARKPVQDVLAALRACRPLPEAGDALYPNGERYLKAPERMRALFADAPQALTRTIEIAEACHFSLAELRYRYPSEWIPEGLSAREFLEQLTWKGASRRYAGVLPDAVRTQLEHELALIGRLGYADYFLTIWDVVEFARSRGILCQGRGSAANSAVCYVLGITAVDPARMSLLFERFISMERAEPPDIDVDFEAGRREEVIQYIYNKYGRDRAGMVAAVVTYRERLAARDAARALGAEPDSRLARAVAGELEGFPRHLSIHSGGFTLSRDPLIETVPVEPARMDGRTIIQWDKNDLETVGLLKVDILALGMLSALQRCFTLLGGRLDLASIPADDPPTWEMIQAADTVGTFQIESRAQMGMLPRLRPREFYDLVVQVAIVRPGPIVGKMVHPYLRRRRGEEPVTLPHPALGPILGRTLGVPIFQEQVMRIAMALAGFTAGQADELRRAMGAWKTTGSLREIGLKLRAGLLAGGLPPEFVERIFEQIRGFAEYGFPESHAASFAHLTWASCYLKRHFPAEFLCALLNSQPMGFYPVHTLVEDARRHGVRVLGVDPRSSNWESTVPAPGTVRLGWNLVRGMSEKDAHHITTEREKRGEFATLADFLVRTRLRSPVLHELALGGAFACFGLEPRQALWEVLAASQSELGARAAVEGPPGEQLRLPLFEAGVFAGGSPHAAITPVFSAMTEYESVTAEHRAFGLSTRGHPMRGLRALLPELPRATITEIKARPNSARISVAGLLLVSQRPPTAKGTAFGTLEDETGLLDLIFRKEIFEKIRQTCAQSPWMTVHGSLRSEGGAVSVLVREALPVFPPEEISLTPFEAPAEIHCQAPGDH